VKLSARFTLALAMAALVPISVAAVVTRQTIAASYRSEYEDLRTSVAKLMQRQLDQITLEITKAVDAVATPKHPLVGEMLTAMANQQLHVRDTSGRTTLDKLQGNSKNVMEGLSLDILTVTETPGDRVLISAHNKNTLNERAPEVREQARTKDPFFSRDEIASPTSEKTILVIKAARVVTDRGKSVAVWVGRELKPELLASVRGPRVDARVIARTNEVLMPSAAPWPTKGDPPIRVDLYGPSGGGHDGKPLAHVDITVASNDPAVLRQLTYTSIGLAVAALVAVILLGIIVARRTARDLDALVAGSLAAARGDLDHRVPVRSKDEVGAVANAFNFMMEDLKVSKERLVIAERIAAWQEIARRLAHEIKNPLTPIQMAMDNLRKTWKIKHPSFDEILEESTSTVLQEADRLKHIVAEFSDFARMPKPDFQRLDLNEVIRSAMSLYQGTTPVETKLSPLPKLDADKGQVNQVVLNLVENARDAIGSRSGGKIVVSTKLGDAGDRALLVVEDNGPGVPSDLKDKVFAPYFTTKHNKGGTGLGLAIVHRIVSDHGGRIQVSDAPGGGARFAIELPLRNGIALLASRI
jgi:two-component system nitrogen regulation sensor histidine kinase NtrY